MLHYFEVISLNNECIAVARADITMDGIVGEMIAVKKDNPQFENWLKLVERELSSDDIEHVIEAKKQDFVASML